MKHSSNTINNISRHYWKHVRKKKMQGIDPSQFIFLNHLCSYRFPHLIKTVKKRRVLRTPSEWIHSDATSLNSDLDSDLDSDSDSNSDLSSEFNLDSDLSLELGS